MVNFKIVENPMPVYLEKYEEFIELYNDKSITIREILKILGWSSKSFEMAKKNALAEGRIKLRRPCTSWSKVKKIKKPPKYYSYDKNAKKYAVKKSVYNRDTGRVGYVYYGLYSSEDVAKLIVEELKKVDWDKSKLEDIKLSVGEL